MKKVSIFMIILLLLLIAAFSWQWSRYKNELVEVSPDQSEVIYQDINVDVREGELRVKQLFRGLEDGKQYPVTFPKNAENFQCSESDGEPCKEGSGPGYYFSVGDELQFDFKIKIDGKADRIMVNDWLVLLEAPDLSKTRMQLVDKRRSGGTWVTGLPLKGDKKGEIVDYYVFQGSMRNNFSMYWQKEGMVHHSFQDGITYYSPVKDSVPISGTFDKLLPFGETSHVTVVFEDQSHLIDGNGVILINTHASKREMEFEIAKAFIKMKLPFLSKDENWLIEALASLVTDTIPEHPKSQSLIDELSGKLTLSEKNAFKAVFYSKQRSYNYEWLDKQLATIKGMNTDFFTLNRKADSSFHPLFFYENREIRVNGERRNLKVAIEGETRLYPIEATMEYLGYDVNWDKKKESIKIMNDRNIFQFNLKNNTFAKNNKQFGLLENPFKKINGTIYVEQHWLTAIFDISIKENEKGIFLSL